MTARSILCVALTSIATFLAATASAEMKAGPVTLNSIGPMTFAPGGVLLVGDPKTATLYAFETGDAPGDSGSIAIPDIEKAVAATLQSGPVKVGELAVNPETGHAFVSVSAAGKIRVVKVASDNTITELDLSKVGHARKVLANPPEDKPVGRRQRNYRNQSITDLAFFDGKVMVTGYSASTIPSRVVEFEFPFSDNSVATGVEIFHAAHGRVETPAIQTFLPMVIDGEPNVLAGFTCTPLVRFPVEALDGAEKVRGTTVAELGNRNQPLDMVVYEKDGKTSILMNNSSRGMMKITTEGITERETLAERVSGGGTAGQPFETVEALSTVKQMDKLDDAHALAIVQDGNAMALRAIELP